MFTYNYVRYNHHKPPYVIVTKYYYSSAQNKKCKSCPHYASCCTDARKSSLAQIPIRKETTIEDKPQSLPVLQCSEAVPKNIKAYSDNTEEINLTFNTGKVDLPNPGENQRLAREEIIMETQNAVKIDTKNDSTVISDDNKHTGEGSQNTASPLTPEKIPVSNFSEYNENIIPTEKGQTSKGVTERADDENNGHAGHSGLLHYRKWWELIEVDISVCGKIITGIPIFIEENTLRVINNSHSYFIPLEKVDYIRTTDGLRSGFDLPNEKP